MEDVRVPLRVRRDLNVESGLNDGIATPFVMFFIAGAAATEVADSEGAGSAAIELAIGVGVGAAIGLLGGHLLGVARARGWVAEAFFPSAVLGLALLSYATAIEAGGNGFVAAFIGGMAFGTVKAGDNATLLSFNDKSGELLSLARVVPLRRHDDRPGLRARRGDGRGLRRARPDRRAHGPGRPLTDRHRSRPRHGGVRRLVRATRASRRSSSR